MVEENRTPVREERVADENLAILYQLQSIDSQIDAIVRLRGELPLEVQDLEDEIEGLKTRVANLEAKIAEGQESIATKRQELKSIEALMAQYTEQQKNVRNNREFDALTKELEFQKLEVELRNKQIKDLKAKGEELSASIEETKKLIEEREIDLREKRAELDALIAETGVEEEKLREEASRLQAQLPDRLLRAYLRICRNVRNGLGVVTVVRGACGGCFRSIPPQRQLDIRSHKRVVVCENCGRIIVDDPNEELPGEDAAEGEKREKTLAKRRKRADR